MRTTITLALLTGAALSVSPATKAATASCDPQALTALHVPDVTIAAATAMPAKDGAPAHCLVEGSVVTRGSEAPNKDFDVDPTGGMAAASTIREVDAAYAQGVTHDPARLRTFIRQGRKMIMYHGFSDPGISPFRTTAFYEALAKQQGGYARAQQSVRLFMVPGMAHCSGGPGPDSFDTLSALESWVEHHVPPTAILATATAPGATKRTMPLCRFPQQAMYRGTGDVNDATNWSCTANEALLQRPASP